MSKPNPIEDKDFENDNDNTSVVPVSAGESGSEDEKDLSNFLIEECMEDADEEKDMMETNAKNMPEYSTGGMLWAPTSENELDHFISVRDLMDTVRRLDKPENDSLVIENLKKIRRRVTGAFWSARSFVKIGAIPFLKKMLSVKDCSKNRTIEILNCLLIITSSANSMAEDDVLELLNCIGIHFESNDHEILELIFLALGDIIFDNPTGQTRERILRKLPRGFLSKIIFRIESIIDQCPKDQKIPDELKLTILYVLAKFSKMGRAILAYANAFNAFFKILKIWLLHEEDNINIQRIILWIIGNFTEVFCIVDLAAVMEKIKPLWNKILKLLEGSDYEASMASLCIIDNFLVSEHNYLYIAFFKKCGVIPVLMRCFSDFNKEDSAEPFSDKILMCLSNFLMVSGENALDRKTPQDLEDIADQMTAAHIWEKIDLALKKMECDSLIKLAVSYFYWGYVKSCSMAQLLRLLLQQEKHLRRLFGWLEKNDDEQSWDEDIHDNVPETLKIITERLRTSDPARVETCHYHNFVTKLFEVAKDYKLRPKEQRILKQLEFDEDEEKEKGMNGLTCFS